MDTLVIVPTWNERANIGVLIAQLFSVMPRIGILVVDDNSPDGTADLVRDMQTTHERLYLSVGSGKEGLGRAYIRGFREALKDARLQYVVMMDADFSHDPAHLPTMMRAIEKTDVVIGSRYVAGGDTRGWDFWRGLLSRGGNAYCKMLLRAPFRDYTGGFYVIRTNVLRKLRFDDFDSSGYAFQIELKYFLWKLGARFQEVPVSFKNRREGESKITSHIVLEGLLAPWKILLKRIA